MDARFKIEEYVAPPDTPALLTSPTNSVSTQDMRSNDIRYAFSAKLLVEEAIMLRRSQSRTLIASAVLLACLALTGQSRAQSSRTGTTAAPLTSKSIFSQGLIARAQRILIAHSARGQHGLPNLQAATLSAAILDHTPTYTALALPTEHPGLHANDPWQSTSRAFAS